ncbi:hypothetical protein [Pseudomonas asiatica]
MKYPELDYPDMKYQVNRVLEGGREEKVDVPYAKYIFNKLSVGDRFISAVPLVRGEVVKKQIYFDYVKGGEISILSVKDYYVEGVESNEYQGEVTYRA